MFEITFTGTGNAGQVPLWGCECPACLRALTDSRYRRRPSSLEIRTDSGVTLVDAGRTDIAERYNFNQIERIILTHFHMDHVQGLFHLRWSKAGQLPVLCPPDQLGADDLFKHPGALDFKPFVALFERVNCGSFDVTPVPLNHSKLTYGYLFEYGEHKLAYLTDTVGLPEETFEFLSHHELDALILDCSEPPRETPPRNHNDYNLALRIAEELRPKQLLLTHLSHDFDAWFMENSKLPDSVKVAHDSLRLRF